MVIAETPEPPYYAVIFTSLRNEQAPDSESAEQPDDGRDDGYDDTAARMIELAREQPGFLGVESVRHGLGITVCYWTDEAAIATWKAHAEHALAQARGKTEWYRQYALRVARVERAYTVVTGAGMPEVSTGETAG
jgi:heme-degrading monooxygenase HmoA